MERFVVTVGIALEKEMKRHYIHIVIARLKSAILVMGL